MVPFGSSYTGEIQLTEEIPLFESISQVTVSKVQVTLKSLVQGSAACSHQRAISTRFPRGSYISQERIPIRTSEMDTELSAARCQRMRMVDSKLKIVYIPDTKEDIEEELSTGKSVRVKKVMDPSPSPLPSEAEEARTKKQLRKKPQRKQTMLTYWPFCRKEKPERGTLHSALPVPKQSEKISSASPSLKKILRMTIMMMVLSHRNFMRRQ
ncbi:uncharacterized protein [Nothobranchius furzeri]|uniref:uncharacterized protein n=1 Tax=Nothobranchius furzeri TaxID=105023 RepID=UPI003904B438